MFCFKNVFTLILLIFKFSHVINTLFKLLLEKKNLKVINKYKILLYKYTSFYLINTNYKRSAK